MGFLISFLGPIGNFVNIVQFLEYFVRLFNWLKNRIRWRKNTKQAREIAFAFHSFSWHNLQQSASTIAKIGLIERPEIKIIQELWKSSDTPILLIGNAGTGKSGIALRLAQRLADEGTPVLFIRATDLPRDQEPIEFIQNRLVLTIPLVKAFKDLSQERICSIVLDQLDSIAGTELCKSLTGLLKALSGIPKVRIIAVSRSYEAEQDPNISSLGFKLIESGNLTPEQSSRYLQKLGIFNPSSELVELAVNLLNLSFIADLTGKTNFNKDNILTQVDLWRKFFISIQQREGEETADFVLHLAREKTAKDEYSFPGDFSNRQIERKLISRGILVEVPGKRLAFRHEQLRYFLCAYALLEERPTIALLIQEFGKNSLKHVLSWLHALYHAEIPNEEPALIQDVLSARSLAIYSRTVILDNLRSQHDPTDQTASILTKHFSEWSYNRYFFDDLQNPSWIIPLYKAGIFSNPPPPIEVEPGNFQLPTWPAGDYLVRFAGNFESIVVEMVRSIKTENWRVQELLIDSLIKITPENATSMVPYIDSWLDGRFSGMLPIKLGELADHFLETGYPQACFRILAIITMPVIPTGSVKISQYSSPLKPRSDPYWVNEFVEKQTPKLSSLDPAGTVDVFSHKLLKAIELTVQLQGEDAELWVGYYWRRDIPTRESTRGNAQLLDILIDGLRDSLAALCDHSPEQGYSTLRSYLSSNHLIFQRLSLFTLRTYGQAYPDLLEQALLHRDYLEESEYATVYRGLLRDQFGSVSEDIRSQVIAWILAGPLDIETRAQNHAKWQNRVVTDEDRREIQEDWTLYHLEIIREYISGSSLDRLNELIVKHGKPDIEELPPIMVTTSGGPPSPVSAADLTQKSFDELQHLFLDYVPEELFLNPRESLAETLQVIVREDPGKYSEFAILLIHPGMRYVYIYQYLFGIRESLKNNTVKLTEPIVRLCEYVAAQKEDPFTESSGQYEPDLSAAQMETARLLEQAMQSRDPYLTRELLDRIRAILVLLCHHPDPAPGQDENASSFDSFTRSLNCVRGIAMHGILKYSLYIIRQYEQANGVKLSQGFLEPEIQVLLEEKLDKSSDPSLTVHSVFGAFFPQLYFLAQEWVVKHLLDIFPEDVGQFRYWKAAWDAYVFVSRVYRDVFGILNPQYQRAVRLMSQPQSEEKLSVRTSAESLAQHILSAYLVGLTDFGHENQLLDLFFEKAPDAVRARGVFWLSQGLEAEKPKATDEIWKKLWVLWEIRLNAAESQDSKQNVEEISEYMRWVDNAPVKLEILYPVLRRSIKFVVNGLDIHFVVSFAAKHCREYPIKAVTLLKDCLINAKESWWSADENDEGVILQTAMKCEIQEARETAEEIINYHGERGDFRWKDLLDIQPI